MSISVAEFAALVAARSVFQHARILFRIRATAGDGLVASERRISKCDSNDRERGLE